MQRDHWNKQKAQKQIQVFTGASYEMTSQIHKKRLGYLVDFNGTIGSLNSEK